ncbi:NADH-quinone oxidoreductase subunit A [Solitalea lacus]|uniref:NADH-quinone oxidoreductase subunit A n=1 Tax=Solitalea lacus TaxID=2911172 RepID=UPI001EDC05BB|nr:NADH-quinone oxidoreductase subunit A [Solitalea lacus]UKJ05895.1 NADH-quinone oxidoreductase subunit A [Solitalea lacus]
MHQSTQISAFGSILLFLLLGTGFVLVTLFMSKLISPNKPNPEKLTTYECGENPTGNSWIQFNMRFYVIALVFLLFDVEMIFLFPWATVFGNKELIAAVPAWGWLSFFEMAIFIAILLVGLVYVWKKGDLEWIKPEPIIPVVESKVPIQLYQNINNQAYKVKPFKWNLIDTEENVLNKLAVEEKQAKEATVAESSENGIGSYKPKFKPKTATSANNETENLNLISEFKDSPIEEKEAYKPKFKPQLAKKSVEDTNTSNDGQSANVEAKPAYTPKFKPRVVAKEPDEVTNEQGNTDNEMATNETEKEKVAYKPKFKPQLLKKEQTEENRESSTNAKDESSANNEEVVNAAPYKPKFKPQLVIKAAENDASDSTTSTKDDLPKIKKDLSSEIAEKEEKQNEVKPATGYKPRFKAALINKTEDQPKE